jgi:Kef-type K+ transport system membrane component KefB
MESLTHLALVWAAIYLAFLLARMSRLTPVLWYLAFGSLMVNVGLLPIEPDPFIRGLGDVGIVMIMFALGFEERTENFIGSIKRSWGIAFFGAVAPFFAAYSVALYFFEDRNIALMCGLSMTATAVSLTMVSLRSEGLQRSPAAIRIMTSAVLDDIAALALVAILVPIASGQADVDLTNIEMIAVKALLFFALVTVMGAWLLPVKTSGWLSRIPFVGRHGISHILGFAQGENAVLTVLLLALLVGLLAHYFGFHPAVGAYMAGLILKEEYFQKDGERSSYLQTKEVVDSVAFYSIGPVFFVELGSMLVFDWDIFVSVIPHTIAMTLALLVAQTSSAALAARYTSGLDWPNSMMVGFGMLGRAELAFVVMDIAYVQNQILSTEAFYTLMFTAFWLNVAVPVTITLWKPFCEGGKPGPNNVEPST